MREKGHTLPMLSSCIHRSDVRKLPYAKVRRPLMPIASGIVMQPQSLPSFKRFAAESLDKERRPGVPAFGRKGTRPLEIKWPRTRTGFAAVDHPLQLSCEGPKLHRGQLGFNADAAHDCRNSQQFGAVTLQSGLVRGDEEPDV